MIFNVNGIGLPTGYNTALPHVSRYAYTPPLKSPNRSKWPPILLIIDFLNHPWPSPYLIPCIDTVAPCRVPNSVFWVAKMTS